MAISGVVVNYNEAPKLEECLKSIKDFASEIIVIDLGSADNTLEIADNYGARVINHPHVDYVEKIRNFAIQQAKNEWVLILDPDEKVTRQLKDELKKIVNKDNYQAVNIPRKNIFFGTWIKHTNFWPDRHIRFFKKNAIDWPDKIHTYPKVDGEIFVLPAEESLALEHFGYDSYQQFFSRQVRYANAEARYKKSQKESIFLQIFWQPIREFLVRFIKHQGYLDGLNGLFLVLSLMWYQFLVGIKMLEIRSE